VLICGAAAAQLRGVRAGLGGPHGMGLALPPALSRSASAPAAGGQAVRRSHAAAAAPIIPPGFRCESLLQRCPLLFCCPLVLSFLWGYPSIVLGHWSSLYVVAAIAAVPGIPGTCCG
jgi:hypothetical protein